MKSIRARIRMILDFHRDLAIDDEAMPVVLDLLDRLHAARAQLRDVLLGVAELPESEQAAILHRMQGNRMMTIVPKLALAVSISCVAGAAFADEPSAVGYWVTPEGADPWCRSLLATADYAARSSGCALTRKPGGRSHTTSTTPKSAKRNQPICGLIMAGSLKPAKGGSSEMGRRLGLRSLIAAAPIRPR